MLRASSHWWSKPSMLAKAERAAWHPFDWTHKALSWDVLHNTI